MTTVEATLFGVAALALLVIFFFFYGLSVMKQEEGERFDEYSQHLDFLILKINDDAKRRCAKESFLECTDVMDLLDLEYQVRRELDAQFKRVIDWVNHTYGKESSS